MLDLTYEDSQQEYCSECDSVQYLTDGIIKIASLNHLVFICAECANKKEN